MSIGSQHGTGSITSECVVEPARGDMVISLERLLPRLPEALLQVDTLLALRLYQAFVPVTQSLDRNVITPELQ